MNSGYTFIIPSYFIYKSYLMFKQSMFEVGRSSYLSFCEHFYNCNERSSRLQIAKNEINVPIAF